MKVTSEYARRSIREDVAKFLVPLRRAGLKDITLNGYQEILYRDLWNLHTSGYTVCPSKIGPLEIDYLISDVWTGAPKYIHNRRSVFFRFLDYYENKYVKEYPMPRGFSQRTTIGPDKWLSDAEAVAMYDACENPLEKYVIHAELKLALRRFDLSNITRDDVYLGYIDVLGKGSKREPVAFVGDTRQVLEDLYVYLDEITKDVTDVPQELLLYRKGKYKPEVGVLRKTALDNIVKDVARRAGIERSVSHHMLRRTCARMWIRSGASVDEVQRMLRHSSRETTMIYLGLTVDDKSVGAMRFDDYFNRQRDAFSETAKKNEASKERWTGRDLNSRPLPCQGSDLPTDLPAR